MKPLEDTNLKTAADAARETVLPPAALGSLVLDAAPVEVPPGLPARVRDRLTARIAESTKDQSAKSGATAPHAAASGADFINIRYADGWSPWPGAHGKAEIKTLFDDGITCSMLVRMEAGASIEGHSHDAPEECLCVQGDVWLNDSLLKAGDYEVALPGTDHHRIKSESGCLLFVRAPSPRAGAAQLSA
jgi:quercetin dioxygenase-like cupin family protein